MYVLYIATSAFSMECARGKYRFNGWSTSSYSLYCWSLKSIKTPVILARFTMIWEKEMLRGNISTRAVTNITDFAISISTIPRRLRAQFLSEHDKTNTMTCAHSVLYYQLGHQQSLINLRRPSEESMDPWLPIKRTAKTLEQTGWMLRLSLFFLGAHII